MTISIPKATSYVHVFKVYLASDHLTAATGKTVAITISKNGQAFGNPNAGATNATEISGGWYKVTLDTTDTGTNGWLAISGTASLTDTLDDRVFVVNATNGGMTALPDTAVTTNGSLLTAGTSTAQLSTSSGQVLLQTGTGTGQLDFTSGVVKSNLAQILGTALTETSGQIAAAFRQFFNISSPTSTMNVITTVTTTTNLTNGATLTSGERNSVADALLDRTNGIETSWTPRQALRVILSMLAGKSHGLDTTAPVFRDVNDTTDRVTFTADSSGNRTATTYINT